MRTIFWISASLVVYAYAGYPLCLWLWALVRKSAINERDIEPTVSMIIAVRNEEANLPRKIENLLSLDYPKDRLETIIVSNGSTDRTEQILQQEGDGLVFVNLAEPCGKAMAINEAVNRATGAILFFQDARQQIDRNAVRALVRCFADEEIGAVSGELVLEQGDAGSSDGLGVYWKIEKIVRRLESASGSTVGVTGAIYAIRRELFTEIPRGTLLDDVFVPMCVARMGKRVVFKPEAIAHDRIFVDKSKEFSRKVRTLTGNYQLLRLLPWLLTTRNPLLFRFISHKMLRLLVPGFLVVMLGCSFMSHAPEMRAIFWMQLIFYVLALLGTVERVGARFRPAGIAHTFVILNMAAAFAFFNFVTRRDEVWG